MRELSREVLAAGKFISLEAIRWTDAEGKERIWETAERKEQQRAVMLIAWLSPSQRLVLVRQYRPPAQGWVVEFPAGLIDGGETPESAAMRELYEETGYRGQIEQVLPPAYNTPGLSSEAAYPVLMEIDETLSANILATPHPDEGENIELLLVERERLAEFVEKELAAGSLFDNKVIAYIAGLYRAV